MRFHPAPWLLIAAGLLLVCATLILAAGTPAAVFRPADRPIGHRGQAELAPPRQHRRPL